MREWRAADDEASLTVIDDVREVRASAGYHLASQRAGEPADARSQVEGERREIEPRRRCH
jgi:hypothetical protein